MSFYVYHGKLGKDLLVAILPNGTVEVDDKLYLSSENGLFSYRAREVTVLESGEDQITFADGLASYVAVSKQGYKELTITRTTKTEKVSTTLTRNYDQPSAAITSTTNPRIWSGRLDFHDWAKNEEIIIVAPKGLGNKKPVVAMWQWTKDQHKESGTLSTAVGEQVSDASTPSKFSFTQNGFYTLTCEANPVTGGLGLKIKGPASAGDKNGEVTQQELRAIKVDVLEAEARFTPPRAIQTKFQLDCSWPAAKPQIARVQKQLPFPAGLIESLQHTAAYLDHAGGLAKYANKEFDKLYDINEKLEKRVEARDRTIVDLNNKNKTLEDANKKLTIENGNLKKDLDKLRETSLAEKKALQDQLKKALDALAASEAREKAANLKIDELSEYIDADKLADLEREKAWERHVEDDEKAFAILAAELGKAMTKVSKLEDDLQTSNKKVQQLTADLKVANDALADALVRIAALELDIIFERARRDELLQDLATVQKLLMESRADAEHLRSENQRLELALATATLSIEALTKERDDLKTKLAETEQELKKTATELATTKDLLKTTQAALAEAKHDLEESEHANTGLKIDMRTREEQLRLKEIECEDWEAELKEKNRKIARMDEVKDKQEKLHAAEIYRKDGEIARLTAKKAPVVSVAEIKA